MENVLKSCAKKIAKAVFGDYSAYYIYSQSLETALQPELPISSEIRLVDEIALSSCQDPLIHLQAGYAGHGSYAYAYYENSRIVSVCFYWFGDRYRKRNFWPLEDREAKLVQIVSIPDVRGRGVATKLIAASCADMMQRGFCQTYSRIWHSNIPSLKAFERARWRRMAFVLEINLLRGSRPVRMTVRL